MTARTLDALLERYPTQVQELARAARSMILETLPDVEEEVDGSAPVIGYGYGTGYQGAVCTLLLSKTGIKLGLSHGASLPDPDRLLGGSGKVHKFVPVSNSRDLRKAGLRKLLKAADAAARERLR